MNKTIVKIAGIVAICLGSVALFLTGIGESVVISIVSAVFVLAGIIAAMFKAKGSKAPDGGTAWIELVSLDTRTRKVESVGTVSAESLARIKKII